MALVVTPHASPADFARSALPFLMRDEAAHCLGLGILETLLNDPARYPTYLLFLVSDGAEVQGVAWMTPPHPLGLSRMPSSAVEALVDHTAPLADAIASVAGPRPTVDEFKERWLARGDSALDVSTQQRIYRIERVISPQGVSGELCVARAEHLDCVVEWSVAFMDDCGLRDSRSGLAHSTTVALRNGQRVLWMVDRVPVSMAGWGGKTPSGMRVNYVYTPPRFRRRGYASALVAALSQKLLSEGRRFCFLYADLANPTSNRIYQRIGYAAVCDTAHHVFRASQR